MEDQRLGTPNNTKVVESGCSTGAWSKGKGSKRGKRTRPKFLGSGGGSIRFGNIARYELSSADFGVPSSVLKVEEEK